MGNDIEIKTILPEDAQYVLDTLILMRRNAEHFATEYDIKDLSIHNPGNQIQLNSGAIEPLFRALSDKIDNESCYLKRRVFEDEFLYELGFHYNGAYIFTILYENEVEELTINPIKLNF